MNPILIYPIGQQDFAGILERGAVYIDKTTDIYNLIHEFKYVFLSRPRRFGKSLLLSTIRYYMEGRKDLFEGLELYKLEKHWKKHPVLHLSLGSVDFSNPQGLKDSIDNQFNNWENIYNIENKSFSLAVRFGEIIRNAYEISHEKVVILIDEYDNPIINSLDNKEIHESSRLLLKSVYSNLKDLDEYIHFAMITGITRFTNTSIFSGINNLKDISLLPKYSSICGFTTDEIRKNLWPGVENLAEKTGCSPDEAMELLRKEYDGYHFSESLIDVYNPFSLLNCLSSSKISNYWVASGVPEFLVKNLRKNRVSFSNIFSSKVTAVQLSTPDLLFKSPVALLYQTGYLTIKAYNEKTDVYSVGIPNREIDKSLSFLLLDEYSKIDRIVASEGIEEMTTALHEGNPDLAFSRLQSLMAAIPQSKRKISELAFERTFFTIFHILGFHIHTEISTSYGRMDVLIKTNDYIYIIELKLDGSAGQALLQIEEKEYALPWKFDNRKIFIAGINFNSKTRNIDSWKIKEFQV